MGIKGQLIDSGRQFVDKLHNAMSSGEIDGDALAEIEREVRLHYEDKMQDFLGEPFDQEAAFDAGEDSQLEDVIDVADPEFAEEQESPSTPDDETPDELESPPTPETVVDEATDDETPESPDAESQESPAEQSEPESAPTPETSDAEA